MLSFLLGACRRAPYATYFRGTLQLFLGLSTPSEAPHASRGALREGQVIEIASRARNLLDHPECRPFPHGVDAWQKSEKNWAIRAS